MTHSRLVAMKAALFAVMALPILLAPVFGQQEVDPTWYNPWPDAAKTATKPAQTNPADPKAHMLTTVSAQQPKIQVVKLKTHGKKRPAPVTQAMLSTK